MIPRYCLPKATILCLCLIFVSLKCKAQNSFTSFYQQQFSTDISLFDSAMANPSNPMGPFPYEEEEEAKEMSSFYRQMEKFYPYGDLIAAIKADSMLAAKLSGGTCGTGNWQQVGPVGDPIPASAELNKNGRLDCIAFKPGDTSTVYVGSGGGGGLWKVNITTGVGQNLNTDRISLHTGVGAVCAIPGRIIIATGKSYGRVYYDQWEFSCTGVYYTDNEGLTWTKATVTDKNSNDPFGYGYDKKQWVSRIISHPTNPDTMFMTVFNVSVIFNSDEKEFGGLYKSTDGGATWNEVDNNSLANRFFKDIEFNPIHPDTIYLGSHFLYRSLDGGTTWTDITSRLQAAPTRNATDKNLWASHEILIAVPNRGCNPADGDNVVIFVNSDEAIANQNIWNLYRSTDAISSNVNSIVTTTHRSRIHWASPWHGGMFLAHDPDTLYLGGAILQRSDDGGENFSNRFYGDNLHPDNQQIISPPFSGQNGRIVLVCTDGGLYRSNNYGNTFNSLNDDLSVTQFYGLGVSQVDNTIVAGSQDNFNMRRDNSGVWTALEVGDGFRSCAINPNNTSQYAYGSYFNTPSLIRFVGGNGITLANINDNTFAHSPITFQHNEPSTLLAASDRLYRETNGTITSGARFRSCLGADSTHWLNGGNSATAIGYSYSNPNVIYVATTGQWQDGSGHLVGRDATINYSDPNGYLRFNLFKSTNGGVTWTDISLNSLGAGRSGYISSIAVHPSNPDTFWVTYSGYAARFSGAYINQNVIVNTGGGNSNAWNDYNTGLPFGSTKDIVYQQGSNNLLYVALESGIYYRDRTMSSWECMDNGLPTTNITDIEISYCSGKLNASTFGRGVWATDLLNYSPPIAETITTNTTWSSSRYFTGNVHVTPGNTLTINGATTIIKMPKNGVIKVDSGAYLIVDSATITNGCNGCQWEGIQLGGRNSDDQSTTKQGRVWLTDATIEHAKIAISNKYVGGTGYPYSGGRILAERTRFINNSRSVKLWQYYNPGGKYAATFKQCTFLVDSAFKGDTNASFFSHIDLNSVDGPIFFGCNFLNRFTGVYRCLGYGIRAIDAGFKVKHHCTSLITNPCTTSVRSQFKGFLYGIYADRVYGDFGMEVDRADFDSCSFGIRAINLMAVPVITRDTFHVGHGIDSYIGFECHKNVGIFATTVTQFIIEDNYFKGYTEGWQHASHDNVGTLMEDCRDNDKLIYKCYFTELDRANLSWGTNTLTYMSATANTDPRIFTGLRYHCNTFVNDTTDICVEGVNFTGGIAAWQGSPTVSAGNTFGASSHNHLKVVNAPYPMYYSGSGSNQIPNQPSLYINNAFASSNNSCTSSIDFPYPTQTKLDKKAAFYSGRTALNAMITTLSGAIDNGNTASLVSYIEGSTEPDAEDVKTTLLGYSPYLSGTVLRAIANKNILTQGDLTEILQANPDMLRYPDLLDYLHTSIPNPYDNGEIDALITASHDTTSRTTLEANIYKQRSEISLLVSELIADMQLDSANTDIDSIPVWYGNMNTLAAEYGKVSHYTGIGNYTAAADALDDISNNISLSDAEQAELENYIDFWTLIKNVKLDNRGFDELTGGEISDLATVLGNSHTNDWVNVGVGTFSSDPGDPMRIPCVKPDGVVFTKRGLPEKNTNKNKPSISSTKKYVKAYPNPANDHVTFDYMIPGKNLNLSMSVVNVLGQKVKEMPLKTSTGKVQWDTRSVPIGVYIFKLYDGAKIVETGRLVISR